MVVVDVLFDVGVGFDFDIDIVLDFRRHESRRKRRMATVARIEGRFPHQTVYAGLGAQPAESVRAFETHGRAFDAGNVALGNLDQLGFESLGLAPAQIHAQQHVSPVLRLGTAGARLDVEESIVFVHLSRKHASEFQLGNAFFDPVEIGFDLGDGGLVVFADRKFEQLAGIAKALRARVESEYYGFKRGFFLTQLLGALRIAPDVGVFKFELNLFQFFAFLVVVKDTPVTGRDAI